MGVSIHVPLAEHDGGAAAFDIYLQGFNSRAPRGARLGLPSLRSGRIFVSIHVPLAEHDNSRPYRSLVVLCFNSRAPRGARRDTAASAPRLRGSFNSRAPRGARPKSERPHTRLSMFQFTCPSRSTTAHPAEWAAVLKVSIHVPLAEHDRYYRDAWRVINVSIHVPLAEHDLCNTFHLVDIQSFNSRAPRGARHAIRKLTMCSCQFQFTCPSRSTTFAASCKACARSFQFTCPSRSTTQLTAQADASGKFQFTCPSRSTTEPTGDNIHIIVSFNSRAPRGARRVMIPRC